jgi:uncharacterized membrane protein
MKRTYIPVLSFVAIALLTQWLVIKHVPDLVHAIAIHRVPQRNQWINNDKTDASMRRVVLPNPDFKYSALFYDVTGHDITITGTLPDSSYASVAFYDNRCQPYYVYNNLSPERKGHFEFLISKNGVTGPKQIKPKTNTGVIICRYLVKNDSSFAIMKSLQQQLACTLK